MLQHFKIVPFIVGLVIGIVGIYYVKPQQTVEMKYPTPESATVLTYKDKNGICYKYDVKEVNCDSNESRLKSFPLL